MISSRRSLRKSKNKPDNYGVNQGDNNNGGINQGHSKVSSVKKRQTMGYKKCRLKSQPPARKSTGMLSASLESEYEEKSDRKDDRRVRTCGSAKQGGRNETGRKYADDSPNTNENGRLIGTTKSGYKQQ